MGCKAAALQRALWGEFAYQPKTKRIVRIKADQQGRAKPLFVQLALEPIWKVCVPGHSLRGIAAYCRVLSAAAKRSPSARF